MPPSSILVLKAAVLFYGEREIKIYRSEIQDKTIRLFAKKIGTHSKCPSCMESSGRVRSSYVRTLMDLPLAANAVFIILKVRRFACNVIMTLVKSGYFQKNVMSSPKPIPDVRPGFQNI